MISTGHFLYERMKKMKTTFEDGVLSIGVQKAEPKKLDYHKYIAIEG